MVRKVGGKTELSSEIEIHQYYPKNRANSCHIKTTEARKLKFLIELKIYHTKLSSENDQGDLSTLHKGW